MKFAVIYRLLLTFDNWCTTILTEYLVANDFRIKSRLNADNQIFDSEAFFSQAGYHHQKQDTAGAEQLHSKYGLLNSVQF
jgi:hypothetical protein